MDIPDDPLALALGLSALLIVCLLFSVPILLRVIRMRRFERRLGPAYTWLLVALAQRDSIHNEPPKDA